MSEIIKAIFLGIVEGITEWLPISSTGHLIIVQEFLNLNKSKDFIEMFNVVIQLGAIMAVVIIFWKKLWPFGKEGNKHPLNKSPFGQMVKTDIFTMWFKVIVACIPAIIIGILGIDEWVDEHFYNPWVIAVALITFGIAFIVVENWNKKRKPKVKSIDELTYQTAFIIGMFFSQELHVRVRLSSVRSLSASQDLLPLSSHSSLQYLLCSAQALSNC